MGVLVAFDECHETNPGLAELERMAADALGLDIEDDDFEGDVFCTHQLTMLSSATLIQMCCIATIARGELDIPTEVHMPSCAAPLYLRPRSRRARHGRERRALFFSSFFFCRVITFSLSLSLPLSQVGAVTQVIGLGT